MENLPVAAATMKEKSVPFCISTLQSAAICQPASLLKHLCIQTTHTYTVSAMGQELRELRLEQEPPHHDLCPASLRLDQDPPHCDSAQPASGWPVTTSLETTWKKASPTSGMSSLLQSKTNKNCNWLVGDHPKPSVFFGNSWRQQNSPFWLRSTQEFGGPKNHLGNSF